MPSSGRSPRHRRRRSKGGGLANHREAYLFCLGSIATCCVAAAALILIVRPSWTTRVLRLPLGAYLLGGLGGVLTLAAEDWDEADMPVGLRLIVGDSGPGLTEAERVQLFKPFYTAKKPGGTGLGLWVSQSLVERYGGKITVDSEAGHGSRFSVWLRFEPLPVERGA